jgi:hypothetical protein
MSHKIEKITITTMIDTYGDTNSIEMTALDRVIPLIEKYADSLDGADFTLIDWDVEGEYELVKKPEAKEMK